MAHGKKQSGKFSLRQGKYRSPVDPRKARDKVACKNCSILKYDHQGIFLFILFADRIAFSAFLVRLFAPFKYFIELKTFLSKKTFIEAKKTFNNALEHIKFTKNKQKRLKKKKKK